MIEYKVQEHPDGSFVIQGREGNVFWLVEAVFESHEKEYADAFCKILNTEANRVYDSAEFKMSKSYYNATEKFFDFHTGMQFGTKGKRNK